MLTYLLSTPHSYTVFDGSDWGFESRSISWWTESRDGGWWFGWTSGRCERNWYLHEETMTYVTFV